MTNNTEPVTQSKDELQKIFKDIYRKWENWARTGDPSATRQELIDALVEVSQALITTAINKELEAIKSESDEARKRDVVFPGDTDWTKEQQRLYLVGVNTYSMSVHQIIDTHLEGGEE